MDFETALRARLKAAPAVAALVGTRIEWLERPQGRPMPDITLSVISDTRDRHMKGFQTLQFTRVQVDCRAATYLEAKATAEAAIAAAEPDGVVGGIHFRRAEVIGPRDLGEQTDAGFVYRKQFDLIIPHSPA